MAPHLCEGLVELIGLLACQRRGQGLAESERRLDRRRAGLEAWSRDGGQDAHDDPEDVHAVDARDDALLPGLGDPEVGGDGRELRVLVQEQLRLDVVQGREVICHLAREEQPGDDLVGGVGPRLGR